MDSQTQEKAKPIAAAPPQNYAVEAINLFDTINIKTIRSLLSGKVIDSSPQELQLQYGENSYLFVYRFGCLVFFNASRELIDRETGRLRAALGGILANPTTETYQVVVADGPPKVEFEYVELKKLTLDPLRMIAMSIGQSAALEYFEVRSERMLLETAALMNELAAAGGLPFASKRLLKLIGSIASTRQYVMSNLSILDPPDETWKSKELERLYKELQGNFDIDVRFRTLDRKLTLVQDNIELLTGLIEAKKTNFLEMLIVILIVTELVLAVLSRH